MGSNRIIGIAGLSLVLFTGSSSPSLSLSGSTPQTHRRIVERHQRRKKLLHKGGWAGAGLAAGAAAGPAGSAAVGVAKYRKDLKAGGSKRNKAVAKIGAPIAAGAVAGPAGTAGVEVVEHRHWIKRHIFHRRPHPSKAASRRGLQKKRAGAD